MHDLRDGEPLKQEVAPVQTRAPANLAGFRRSVAQLLDQLIQEQGYSLIDLRFRNRCETPRLPQVDGETSEYRPVQIHHLLFKDRRTNATDSDAKVMIVNDQTLALVIFH